MAKLTASEQLLYSTIRLEATGTKGTSTGTGFFYRVPFANAAIDVVVTNKHVIEDCASLRIHCHQANPAGDGPLGHTFMLKVAVEPGAIARHPDPAVDLCAVSIPIQQYAMSKGERAFYVVLDRSLIPTVSDWENFDAFEEILMVGCPNGLYDQVNNVPIFRRGITASHPAKKYNGADEFLIDAACYPGSSGSPVILYDALGHFDKKSGSFKMGSPRLKLMGVLHSGPTINQKGELTLSTSFPVSVTGMMHLGMVMRSSRLVELEQTIISIAKSQGS